MSGQPGPLRCRRTAPRRSRQSRDKGGYREIRVQRLTLRPRLRVSAGEVAQPGLVVALHLARRFLRRTRREPRLRLLHQRGKLGRAGAAEPAHLCQRLDTPVSRARRLMSAAVRSAETFSVAGRYRRM